MDNLFRTLRDDEIEIVSNAPALVALLIAGADGKVDKTEVKSAIEYVANAQTKFGRLHEFCEKVRFNFEDLLNRYINDLPKELESRQREISTYLSQLNNILPKLDEDVVLDIHGFLLDLGVTVAKSSGGVLGMNKISSAEAKYLKLDMINVVGHFARA